MIVLVPKCEKFYNKRAALLSDMLFLPPTLVHFF